MITKRQKNRVAKIISRDCMVAGMYLNEDGTKPMTCAIGELALNAGVSPRYLRQHNRAEVSELPYLIRRLGKVFGLDRVALTTIQQANDYNGTPASRRRAILKFLKKL